MEYINYEFDLDLQNNKISALANTVYIRTIEDYHTKDDLNATIKNAYHPESVYGLLYYKCWIDTVQWHLEDEIRKVDLDPYECLSIKRRIDKSNQDRTNIVEVIDDYFLHQYSNVKPAENAKLNTESPAWALDRLSILALKIYHMQAEVQRVDTPPDHYATCSLKLETLTEQREDLCKSIDELHHDIAIGAKQMKVYRQIKMYNDPNLNPVLYNSKLKS
ncbi:Protein of unknown function [Mucilaginibacter lappiensis]|uniref:DUF4254 domain-containing protein n=1 Tax=Mucilaginibacter lappiensis TaxID=354630 RepID=A0ABR6PS52_9SPHI|nr:DUF4254 domain-containing protein [Mucilaginibacter lappiensis]MBB6112612.1 hypothetical protein [Mucilaginibacter lappiensis]SIS05007.1 Protein of unknown function [Mucilaginibacter lappiensis]